MEAEERARLEEEINSKRSEVEDILTEVQKRGREQTAARGDGCC